MLKSTGIRIKILIISLILIFPELISVNQLFAQRSDSVRVAIVYNASKSGLRYRDGVIKAINESKPKYVKLKIIQKPYIKASHGEDTIKKIMRNDLADVILGPTESDVFTKVYNTDGINDNKISVISGMATTNIGNDSQGFFFRLNLEATSRVFEVWSYMNKFWISKIAVIYEDSEFGRNAELALKDLIRGANSSQDIISIPFNSPQSPVQDIEKLIEDRPEVIGLFCEREDMNRLYRQIHLLNNSGVPYNPYFFTIIDITNVGEGLKNFYFPSLKKYDHLDTTLIGQGEESEIEDEVYILGQVTGNLLIEALNESGDNNDISTFSGRLHFRNQVVGLLRGESDAGLGMNFLKMKNLGPPYLYKLDENKLSVIDQDKEIFWWTMVKAKVRLVYAIHNYKLILNLLIMIILTISISTIEIRRSFPKKHVKIYRTPVFYYFLLANLSLVLFLFIYLAETGRINYSDTIMAIIITVTPSAFFKTTFFESKSGRSFGLEDVYKRVMASIDAKIMSSRYEKLVGLENVIAYSNSEDSMRQALLRMYRNNPSKAQSAKLIQKMEEELGQENDYMKRKRAGARLIMRQFDRDQLIAEGFVPPDWDYKKIIDPVILLRQAAKYCAKNPGGLEKVLDLLADELKDLRLRSSQRYKEMNAVHKKELSITMSREGELLVKLRLLMVLRGFDEQWLIQNGLLDDAGLKIVQELSKPKKLRNKERLARLMKIKKSNQKEGKRDENIAEYKEEKKENKKEERIE